MVYEEADWVDHDMVVTWEEALAESRAEGEVKATQENILLFARHRFPALPADFEAKLRSIEDLERLDQIVNQILEVDSIDEVKIA